MRRRCLFLAIVSGALLAPGPGMAQTLEARASVFFTVGGRYNLDRFGSRVAGLSDFDGDGAADLAVAATGFPGGRNAGRVFVYGSRGSRDTIPDWTVGSVRASEGLGGSLASTDWNGDGYSDLVVGSVKALDSNVIGGLVQVFFGGADPDTIPDFTLRPTQSDPLPTLSVECPGDVNGDGRGDLLVGTYNSSTGKGKVSLYLGGTPSGSAPALVIHSSSANDGLGTAVCGAADMNGDGLPEIAAGQSGWGPNAAARNIGRVLVFFGGAAIDTLPDRVITSQSAGLRLGVTISSVGDFNGDGRGDLGIVDGSRAVSIHLGGPGPSGGLEFTTGITIDGRAVGVGDLDQDGIEDLALGYSYEIVVVRGRATPVFSRDYVFSPGSTNYVLAGVAPAFDLDGDRRLDLIVGFPASGPTAASQLGRVHAVRFSPIEVLQPNGGERWLAGSRDTVRWRGDTSVGIDFSPDAGTTWTTLFEGPSAQRKVIVDVPQIYTTNALVRVRPLASGAPPGLSDVSNQTFRVLPFRIENPVAGENWLVGNLAAVTWSGRTLADIRLESAEGQGIVSLGSGMGGQQINPLTFTVPLVPDTAMFVRLTAAGSDIGDELATDLVGPIRVHTIRLVTPIAGEQWLFGDTVSVSWFGRTLTDISLETVDRRTIVPVAAGVGGSPYNDVSVAVPVVPDSFMVLRIRPSGSPPESASPSDVTRPLQLLTYIVDEPPAGNWVFGVTASVAWRGRVPADVWIVSPLGAPLAQLASVAGGAASNRITFAVPPLPETRVRVRVEVAGGSGGFVSPSALSGDVDVYTHQFNGITPPSPWFVGTRVNVGWKGPTPADISLETGSSLESIPIASGAGGSESNALEFDLPSIRDTEARIRLRSAGAPGELASTTIASAYFSVSTHQIQALDPGANWIVGDFASVTWRGPTLADISLETLDGRMSVPLVTGAGGSATNVKAFVVPLCPDSLMRLRLSATGSDPGDAFSSVVSGAIRVSTFALTEPSAGADWIVGDSASVAWRGATPADISLATLDGRVSVPLATSAGWARSNRVALAVPPCPDTLMRLRLRATSSDPNDALKTVVSGVIRVSPFALTEPFAGARWIVGDPVAVQWRGSTLADVALESPTGSPLAMLASRTGGAPNNRLVVPAPRVPATSGIVRVRPSDSSGYASTAVVSSPSVRIALFEIQSPNGGESWEAGLPQTVRWRGRTPADLEISDDDGQTWEPMATNVGGQSSNELVIEAPTVRATKLRLRVVARSEPPDTFNSDISDASFSIVGPYRFDTLPRRTNLSLVSNQARAELGSVVADIGDWNGDGYRDLAASAPFATANGFGRAGRVDVYLGGPAPSALSVVTLSGAQFDDQFGASIAAGDLDGDGYSDLLVGAVGDGIDRGAVFVFRGRAHPRTSPDAAYRGVPDMHGFGHSIACSGDLNADGKDDFVAAARIYPALVNSKPLVYFGDDSLDTRADVELEAPPGVDVTNFGHQVSAAGDFNGDGWPDVLVRQQSTSSADTTARVIVFRGGPAFDGIADDQIRGSRVQRFAESAFGGVGDVNGDGFDDVAVGVPGAPAGGEVRVYLGGAARGAVWIYSNGIAGEDLGASIAGGDLNADGYSDVFAGAPLNDEGGSDAGSAYAFAGGPERLSLPALSLTGPVAGGRFGTSLALLPRFWDDDVATFVVGAPADERGGVDAGAVIAQTFDRPDLIAPRGGETAPAGETMSVRWRRPVPVRVELSTDGGISWTTIAEQAGGAAENTVSFDVPEVTTWLARVRVRMSGQAVSAASAETSPEPFRIVPRSREVPAVARRFETGWTRSELRALRVIAAGDLDGDRLEDAFLVSSAEAGARIEAWLADASAPAASFDIPSSEAASAAVVGGDFDGDGRMDVAIGMPADATRGANAGAVRIYRHALEAPADVRTLFGERAGDRFGVALASGDVNQSGPPDLIVGAPSSAASAPRPGVAYVYAGGGSFGTSAPEKLSAGFAGDEFGAAVAFVGDLDLDALGEFLVGAPGRVLAGAASGRVYGYERARGASSSLRRGVIGGGADGDRFGAALAACGDVNGDRYEDVLIGAPGADAPEAGGGMLVDAGAASLYFGGPDFNPAADWEAFGTRAGESFGAALAAGGDLNADGFGDWLVCAPFGGSEERGEALAFFGGTLPDRIADARLEGERPGARLGASLAILGEPLPGEFARVALVEGAGDGGTLREFEVRRWWLEPLAPRWPVGSQREIHWSGAEPADVWLVRDGASPLKIASAAGGARENTLAVTVPAPVGAARIRLTAADAGVTGLAESEAIAITNTVALGTFAARRVPGEGIVLEWTTTPNVADGGVASYRIYRAPPGFPIGERIADGVSGTSLAYAEKVRGAKYTLAAVSAAGEELVLGETSLEAAPLGLRVYPVPVRSGDAVVELAPPLGSDGRTAADFELSVYDVSGRKVETLARGSVQTDIGVLRLSWSGRDREGNRVKAGLYFVRAESQRAGFRLDRRVVLTR